MENNCTIILEENTKLKTENNELRNENNELKKQLKKYTSPERRKKYYEKHKTELIQKTTEYNSTHKPTKEKMSEYNRRAYLKRKEKQDDKT